jgi:hypothetical protein
VQEQQEQREQQEQQPGQGDEEGDEHGESSEMDSAGAAAMLSQLGEHTAAAAPAAAGGGGGDAGGAGGEDVQEQQEQQQQQQQPWVWQPEQQGDWWGAPAAPGLGAEGPGGAAADGEAQEDPLLPLMQQVAALQQLNTAAAAAAAAGGGADAAATQSAVFSAAAACSGGSVWEESRYLLQTLPGMRILSLTEMAEEVAASLGVSHITHHQSSPCALCVSGWRSWQPSGLCRRGFWRTTGPSRNELLLRRPCRMARSAVSLFCGRAGAVLTAAAVWCLWRCSGMPLHRIFMRPQTCCIFVTV